MKSYENSIKYESEKIIYIENKFIDIIIIDKDQYIVLFDLIMVISFFMIIMKKYVLLKRKHI